MTMRQPMTGDFDEPVRFFGWFTWLDLLRIGLPFVAVLQWFDVSNLSIIETLLVLLPAAILSLVWYLWRPYGDPVDVHVFHLGRWFLRVI